MAAGKQRRWDMISSHSSVGVIIYHTQLDALLVVRQFRPAVSPPLHCPAMCPLPVAPCPYPPAHTTFTTPHTIHTPSLLFLSHLLCLSASSETVRIRECLQFGCYTGTVKYYKANLDAIYAAAHVHAVSAAHVTAADGYDNQHQQSLATNTCLASVMSNLSSR